MCYNKKILFSSQKKGTCYRKEQTNKQTKGGKYVKKDFSKIPIFGKKSRNKGRRNSLSCDDHFMYAMNRDEAFLPESSHAAVIEKIFQLVTDNQATKKNLMILVYFDSNYYGSKMG